MATPEIGAPAPSFAGVTQDGTTISLDDFKGRRLALYFYPRDNTPGCTKQACNLRDNYDALGKADIAIVGVSNDSVTKHENFANKYELPFPLIADTENEILQAYGVWSEKSMYGKKYWGTKRQTFLIEKDGTLAGIIEKPKVRDHAAEILAGFGL